MAPVAGSLNLIPHPPAPYSKERPRRSPRKTATESAKLSASAVHTKVIKQIKKAAKQASSNGANEVADAIETNSCLETYSAKATNSSVKDAAAPAAALPSLVPASVPSSAAGSRRIIRTSKRSADTLHDDDEVAESVESVKIAPRKRARTFASPPHVPKTELKPLVHEPRPSTRRNSSHKAAEKGEPVVNSGSSGPRSTSNKGVKADEALVVNSSASSSSLRSSRTTGLATSKTEVHSSDDESVPSSNKKQSLEAPKLRRRDAPVIPVSKAVDAERKPRAVKPRPSTRRQSSHKVAEKGEPVVNSGSSGPRSTPNKGVKADEALVVNSSASSSSLRSSRTTDLATSETEATSSDDEPKPSLSRKKRDLEALKRRNREKRLSAKLAIAKSVKARPSSSASTPKKSNARATRHCPPGFVPYSEWKRRFGGCYSSSSDEDSSDDEDASDFWPRTSLFASKGEGRTFTSCWTSSRYARSQWPAASNDDSDLEFDEEEEEEEEEEGEDEEETIQGHVDARGNPLPAGAKVYHSRDAKGTETTYTFCPNAYLGNDGFQEEVYEEMSRFMGGEDKLHRAKIAMHEADSRGRIEELE